MLLWAFLGQSQAEKTGLIPNFLKCIDIDSDQEHQDKETCHQQETKQGVSDSPKVNEDLINLTYTYRTFNLAIKESHSS